MHGKKHIHRQQIKCTVTEGSLPTFIAELKQREVTHFGADGSISHTGNVGESAHIMGT